MPTLPLLLALALAPLAAMAKDPEVTVTRIENMPNKLFYFDDTPVSSIRFPYNAASLLALPLNLPSR